MMLVKEPLGHERWRRDFKTDGRSGVAIGGGGLALVGRGLSQQLRSAAQMVLLPLTEPGTDLAMTLRDRAGQLGTPSQREQRRIDQLQRDIDTLRNALYAERQRMADRIESERLKDEVCGGPLKDCRDQWNLISARVIGGESLPYGTGAKTVKTSAGKAGAYVTTADLLTDRVKSLPEGLWTLDTKSLVGRITDSGAATARLQLVTDSSFGIAVVIWRDPRITRKITSGPRQEQLTAEYSVAHPIRTALQGDGKENMIAIQVPKEHEVRPGDVAYTAPGQAAPPYVQVAKVTQVLPDPKNAGFVTLVLAPITDLGSLRKVFIVIPRSEEKPSPGGAR